MTKDKLRYSRASKPQNPHEFNKYATLIIQDRANEEDSRNNLSIVRHFFFGKKKFDSNSKANISSSELRQSNVTYKSSVKEFKSSKNIKKADPQKVNGGYYSNNDSRSSKYKKHLSVNQTCEDEEPQHSFNNSIYNQTDNEHQISMIYQTEIKEPLIDENDPQIKTGKSHL